MYCQGGSIRAVCCAGEDVHGNDWSLTDHSDFDELKYHYSLVYKFTFTLADDFCKKKIKKKRLGSKITWLEVIAWEKNCGNTNLNV